MNYVWVFSVFLWWFLLPFLEGILGGGGALLCLFVIVLLFWGCCFFLKETQNYFSPFMFCKKLMFECWSNWNYVVFSYRLMVHRTLCHCLKWNVTDMDQLIVGSWSLFTSSSTLKYVFLVICLGRKREREREKSNDCFGMIYDILKLHSFHVCTLFHEIHWCGPSF